MTYSNIAEMQYSIYVIIEDSFEAVPSSTGTTSDF